MRHEGTKQGDVRGDIDLKHFVHSRVGNGFERLGEIEARVADQNVHATQGCIGVIDQALNAFPVSQINNVMQHLIAGRLFRQLRSSFFELIAAPCRDHHFGTAACQPPRHEVADAGAAAGHQRHLAAQIKFAEVVVHHLLLILTALPDCLRQNRAALCDPADYYPLSSTVTRFSF